ncbi:peptide ABC transporter substrate-binding protein [Saccharopolyspora dendranthemae]|uniref:Oligopeptide transport system substrate-binding protein n=1 Tax=Saccharopolyspora dendranthemae TaxID=1181886 RepID=A0A561TZZ1_9PSEU|nr:ABC transporter substrate-binding protein [Saccharopolyspora dendranthemae]TWF92687.1 oligopeptide transport system substrate-binding protein [Saccharopolyspora dendranthemae]
MRKGRLAAMVAAPLVVAMLATGCGGGGSGSGEDGIVSLHWSEPENPLVPANTTEEMGGFIVDALFTGLVKYRATDMEPENAVAQSIETTDNTNYTIKLKPGWTFHDGTPVKAKNFVDAWNYAAYGPNGLQGASFFEQIDGYEAMQSEDPDEDGPAQAPKPAADKLSGLNVVDDTTFTVKLKAPLTIFPVMLGYSAFMPMPDSFFQNPEAFEEHPIGNGPFKFQDRTPNVELNVAAYDKYAGADKPQIKGANFKVYNELDTAYQDLVSGNLDFLEAIPVSALVGDKWKQDLGERAKQKPGLLTQNVGFPIYDERFKNPLVRKAISMSIDRKTITQQVFSGGRDPADGFATAAVEGYRPGQCGEACEFNPEKAKQYLAQAGGFPGTLTLESNADGGHGEWVQAVAASIQQNLGVPTQFVPVPTFSEFRQKANAFQFTSMFRTGWKADYPNLETFLTQLYRTDASSNDYKYSNPAFDKALDKANAAPTIEDATNAYAEAEKILGEDLPVVPLWTQPVQYGFSEKVAQGEVLANRRLDLTTVKLNP